ncbi:transcriptional regulator CopG family [Candidatus Termititenax aidoneus]|uniref:Transcriptional regulator CopG family n=1 Tax=Termititenax aidoneus TaxID=2218524 RepID=A0A388TB22_TERA1|nr:transcriptional regulator CopG family [Candidatus Termititenax aidoneus]
MKVKTSISLSSDLLEQVDKLDFVDNRSDFIERALWRYLELLRREERNQKDLKDINKSAVKLNKEAADTLLYQVY